MAVWHLPLLLALISFSGTDAAIFTLENKCKETIWPGILAGSGKPVLMNGGVRLNAGENIKIEAPKGWSGRFWPRTGCTFDQSGNGKCVTGDCGAKLNCNGAGGEPPVSLAEFTLDSPEDFYDVSLVDGYNVPMSIIPSGGTGRCKSVSCVSDLNTKCPEDLQQKDTGRVVACKSACMAFNTPEYCCTGAFGGPNTCKPTNYSKIFKESCPDAYSYAYDDLTSTFTCKDANYTISFC
ncbi:pathogenesis-related protein 5 [Citrus clementina]|nr:pathogenesis-related protein 5 [Citrus x clementina]